MTMGYMVIKVCVKSNYDRLLIDKALGIFRKMTTTITTKTTDIIAKSKT